MIWKRTSVVCLAAASALTAAGPDELVAMALERNRALRATAERIAEMKGLRGQAALRPAPLLEVEGVTGRAMGTVGKEEYAAGLAYTVETGGKRTRRVEAASSAVDAARAEWEREARDLSLAVKERYVEAWEQAARRDTLDRLLVATREALRLTTARVQEGDAAPLERQLLEVERSRAEAQRAIFDGRSAAALLELRALVGLDAAAGLELTEWKPAPPPAAAGERPDLRAARAAEQQAASEARLAAAQGRADVTLSARYQHRNERFDFSPAPYRDRDNLLALGVSLPLFTRARNQGNQEAAAARAAAARLRREQLERAAPLELEAARRRYDAALRALEIFGSGVLDASRRNLEIMRQAYDLGHLRMLDVLNEQRRLVDTELASVEARAEWMRARIALERAMGGGAQ